jgi:hypothetical protein
MRVEEANFHTYKQVFIFSCIWTPPIFKAHNFLISSSFLDDLKCYRSATLILQIIFEL